MVWFIVLTVERLNIFKEVFAESLMNKSQSAKKSDIAKKKRELDKAKRRIAELDILFTKLYEDRTFGTVSEERFIKMTASYEQEQDNLNALIKTHEKETSHNSEIISGIDKFLRIASKYLNLQELDGTILRELVEKIVVHEKVKKRNEKGKVINITQQVDIHYNFVGVVEVGES